MTLEVGQQAPDFTLGDENNDQVTLSELRGTPVVLVFYFSDFSGICTAELCEIRDDYSSWMEQGAKVFGISRDSRFVHTAFKQQAGIDYPLLADMNGAVAKAYDTWNDTLAAARRLTVVIDREGKLAYVLQNEIPDARDHSQVDAVIAGL